MIEYAYYCIEDQLSRAALLRLVGCLLGIREESLFELQPMQGGHSSIKQKFGEYCKLAKREQVFILIDLDRAECPPTLRRQWITESQLREPLPNNMNLFIATTEIESWLLADKDNISAFLGVPKKNLPIDSELTEPKEHLLKCVSNYGNREAKRELLPSKDGRVGLGYNAHLRKFVEERWNFDAAAQGNPSLQRAVKRIKSLQ